jgi:hypothetical protein
MSASSSPDGIYTRGVAQPGVCSSNGCSWKLMNGVTTWVCCCNQNLCNTGTPTTTMRPVGNTCYLCSNCPRPFNPYSITVTDTYSSTGWCAVSLFFCAITKTRSLWNNVSIFRKWAAQIRSMRSTLEALLSQVSAIRMGAHGRMWMEFAHGSVVVIDIIATSVSLHQNRPLVCWVLHWW